MSTCCALYSDLLTEGRVPAGVLLSMTISSVPRSLVSRNDTKFSLAQAPQPCWGSAAFHQDVAQQGKRPVHCETCYSLSDSASAPLPTAQRCQGAAGGCCHHQSEPGVQETCDTAGSLLLNSAFQDRVKATEFGSPVVRTREVLFKLKRKK